MSILIDGHNLIPRIPGLNLRQINDEEDLIEILQIYCGLRQKNVVVYFDGAPAGYNGKRKYGRVTAVFVRKGRTADEAIRDHLHRLGNAARNWQVVTSDRQVAAEATSARAQVIASDEFAGQLAQTINHPPKKGKQEETRLSEQEVQEWFEIFGLESDEEDDFTWN